MADSQTSYTQSIGVELQYTVVQGYNVWGPVCGVFIPTLLTLPSARVTSSQEAAAPGTKALLGCLD